VSHFFELSWFARKIVSMHRQNCIKLPLNNNFLTCAGQQFLLLWVREFSLAHKHSHTYSSCDVNWLVVEFHVLSFFSVHWALRFTRLLVERFGKTEKCV
jgi:hypothetical protein